jgi:hypothetical protein
VIRWVALLAAGCAHGLPEEQPCLEAGYAIGARSEACGVDAAVAVERIERLEAEYACTIPAGLTIEQENPLYECALVTRNLACELVVEYGDDLDRWLGSSSACPAILEPR